MFIWECIQRFIAFFLLIPAFLTVLPFMLFILIGSPGPVLIKQIREGKEGLIFKMFKLRTMVEDAENCLQKFLDENATLNEEWLTYGRLIDDPRIAGRIAKFARRYSIDELPQLINVVRGEMNLVGPRPLPPMIARLIPHADLEIRRKVLPGITGLWQISGRSDLSIKEIGRLDRIYVESRSVLQDIWILICTIGVVVSGKGAY